MSRALVVSLHDVSPTTRPACATILAELRACGVRRCSLLVVPNYHHRGRLAEDADCAAWLREEQAAGNEIVIHGYYHLRASRVSDGLRTRLATGFYTAGEGEFYDIDRDSAMTLVSNARSEYSQLRLTADGFIAPAWLLSTAGETALRELACEYTTRLRQVIDLRTGRSHPSQSLVWSTRSAWRRQLSLLWNSLLFRRLASCPLLRVSIHPCDAAHPKVWRQIHALIAQALADREPLTYLAWLERERLTRP